MTHDERGEKQKESLRRELWMRGKGYRHQCKDCKVWAKEPHTKPTCTSRYKTHEWYAPTED